MIVAIIGATGFMGRELIRYYQHKVFLKLVQRRKPERQKCHGCVTMQFDLEKGKLTSLAEFLQDCDIVFNCAYSPGLDPKIPTLLIEHYQQVNPHGKFVHLSSINTVLPQLGRDPYTAAKRKTEEFLRAQSVRIPVLVVRPSFLISSVNAGSLEPFIRCAVKTGIVPVLVPGPTHMFLSAQTLIEIIASELSGFDEKGMRFANVAGKDLVSASTLIRKIIIDVTPFALVLSVPTQLLRIPFLLLPIKPYCIRRAIKFTENLEYVLPKDLPCVIADNDILSMRFTREYSKTKSKYRKI
jgi:nucleoside-diphosphate-sugar epimerase